MSWWRIRCVARPVGSLLASLVAPLLFIASQARRPGETCLLSEKKTEVAPLQIHSFKSFEIQHYVKWIKFSIHVSNEAVLGQKTSFLQQSCATLHWHGLTQFWMRHFWLCAVHLKLPSMCCFYTVRACKKIAEVPPLQIPSFKSFENRTDWHARGIESGRSTNCLSSKSANTIKSCGSTKDEW